MIDGNTTNPTSDSARSVKHERDRGHDQHDHDADRHRQWRDREPDRLDVGVRVGQQLAGRVPVVPGQREPEVLPGHPAPVLRLEPVDHDPAEQPAQHDADRLQHRDRDDQRSAAPERAGRHLAAGERRLDQVLGDPAEHPRVADRHRPEQHAARRGRSPKMRGSSRMATPRMANPRRNTDRSRRRSSMQFLRLVSRSPPVQRVAGARADAGRLRRGRRPGVGPTSSPSLPHAADNVTLNGVGRSLPKRAAGPPYALLRLRSPRTGFRGPPTRT